MRGAYFRRCSICLERTGRDEKVAIEVGAERLEEGSERLDLVRGKQLQKARRGVLGDRGEVGRRDDLPIFKVSDEHRLDQQGLRGI